MSDDTFYQLHDFPFETVSANGAPLMFCETLAGAKDEARAWNVDKCNDCRDTGFPTATDYPFVGRERMPT